MAKRDATAFATFIADEAIFMGAGEMPRVLRGKPAIVAAWKPYFDGPTAPFSWEPEIVEVLDSGGLALTSGPVHDPNGALIGLFNSIWRLEKDGHWRVLFDRGSQVCSVSK
jgi:ketosteroid isomerase-like protein